MRTASKTDFFNRIRRNADEFCDLIQPSNGRFDCRCPQFIDRLELGNGCRILCIKRNNKQSCILAIEPTQHALGPGVLLWQLCTFVPSLQNLASPFTPCLAPDRFGIEPLTLKGMNEKPHNRRIMVID